MKNILKLSLALVAAILTILAGSPARSELRIGGFADFAFYTTDDSSAASRSGFKEGQFVLHLNADLRDRLTFFAELTWTPRASGFGTEVERSIIKYAYSDALKPSVGRYHTAISWWNVAYHHGAWLQTSVDRPVAVKFGSTFIPIHFVGAMLEGKFFPRGFNFSYAGGIGNGRDVNAARAGDAGDANNNRALLVQLGLQPDAFYDLQVGGAVYLDRVAIENGPSPKEQIVSAFVVLAREKPEVLGEFFYVRHEDETTGKATDNTSYYVQVAYRLPMLGERLKPYGRVEEMDIDGEDPVFATVVPNLRRYLAGLRIDFATTAALKLEGRRFRENNKEYVNEFFTSVNIAF